MMTIAATGVWVHDQDVALDFWTTKVGFEVRTDQAFPEIAPGFRWVTVGPKEQPDFELSLLTIPGPPMVSAEQRDLIVAVMSQGLSGGAFFVTDDVQRDYEEMSARGVEFVDLPERRPYGFDCGFRDPSGNQFRLMQVDPTGA